MQLQEEARIQTHIVESLQVRLTASEAANVASEAEILQHKGTVADHQLCIQDLKEKLGTQGQRLTAALAAVDSLQVPVLHGLSAHL